MVVSRAHRQTQKQIKEERLSGTRGGVARLPEWRPWEIRIRYPSVRIFRRLIQYRIMASSSGGGSSRTDTTSDFALNFKTESLDKRRRFDCLITPGGIELHLCLWRPHLKAWWTLLRSISRENSGYAEGSSRKALSRGVRGLGAMGRESAWVEASMFKWPALCVVWWLI